jgi:RimJ/RimL family protein N-acetyltransferase
MDMVSRIVDQQIRLVKYYPNYKTTISWYQDPDVCKQVDNRDSVYDLETLKAMYRFLDRHGDLFYIKFENRLCGDVCLRTDGEVCIVVAKPYQNRRIGRRVMGEILKLAREKGMEKVYATIYSFNAQSRRMFESMGFQQTAAERYEYVLENGREET